MSEPLALDKTRLPFVSAAALISPIAALLIAKAIPLISDELDKLTLPSLIKNSALRLGIAERFKAKVTSFFATAVTP